MELTETIEDWFLKIPMKDNIFPYNYNYVKEYQAISNHLNHWVHPFVNTGAMMRDGGCLTDHGPEHIKKVILRATELLRSINCKLNEYEVFVLLMAIHIHDIGNIKRRKGHEINSLIVLNEVGGLRKGSDRIEWDVIFEIAEAHGGDPKDKISDLEPEKILNFDVNKPLLAAILKFADELADDRTRANRYELIQETLPEESLIYHKYAYALHSVNVDSITKEVSLLFDVEEDDVNRTYLKKVKDEQGNWVDTQQYLIDEIYERTLKTHLERSYCVRFMRPHIEIDVVRVTITVTLNEVDSRDHKRKKRKISYDLGERGYPTLHPNSITSICPQLEDCTGQKIYDRIKNNTLENVSC
jgi:hypothetical protein